MCLNVMLMAEMDSFGHVLGNTAALACNAIFS